MSDKKRPELHFLKELLENSDKPVEISTTNSWHITNPSWPLGVWVEIPIEDLGDSNIVIIHMTDIDIILNFVGDCSSDSGKTFINYASVVDEVIRQRIASPLSGRLPRKTTECGGD